MEIILAVVIGVLYASGVYLMLRRSLVKLLLGLSLLSHGTNLLIFTAAKLARGGPPIIPSNAETLPAAAADPMPQALILTSIVIGLGVTAFSLALAARVYKVTGTDDLDRLNQGEE
ncbi:MAG: Na+/H+ antiporter subunit C [Chloroflexi bacterium]|nr:Na+/H+ antiporter subunit C [Chloroflexota bacterium]